MFRNHHLDFHFYVFLLSFGPQGPTSIEKRKVLWIYKNTQKNHPRFNFGSFLWLLGRSFGPSGGPLEKVIFRICLFLVLFSIANKRKMSPPKKSGFRRVAWRLSEGPLYPSARNWGALRGSPELKFHDPFDLKLGGASEEAQNLQSNCFGMSPRKDSLLGGPQIKELSILGGSQIGPQKWLWTCLPQLQKQPFWTILVVLEHCWAPERI